jgi:DNA repair photolyase
MFDSLAWEQLRPLPQPSLFGEERRIAGKGEYRGLEFIEIRARSIINHVPAAAGQPFEWTLNAYRGCSHACTYCFARPTHEYLGFDRKRDFETKIVVKVNAADLVLAETASHKWGGHSIAMGTNTDPYQPAEGKYRLTRSVIEALVERENPFSLLTKSPLVLRDRDLLADAAAAGLATADFSIGTLDEDVWRSTEPDTPHPRKRIEAVRRLNEAGIPSGVLMGPVLPGISDSDEQLEQVVAAAVAAGARFIAPIMLHLKPGVREDYLEWLGEGHRGLIPEYLRRYRRGAYAPESSQRELQARIRALVAEHGGDPRPRPPRRPTATVAAASAAQQSLF